MIKTCLNRGVHSFCYSIAITAVIYYVIMQFFGYEPMLPEYADKFANTSLAMVVQLILIGVMSFSLAAGTVIMEFERLSLMAQSIIYYVLASVVWICVACYCWGFGKYPGSTISILVSYSISYVICWVVQYRKCKRNIEEINMSLTKKTEGQNNG